MTPKDIIQDFLDYAWDKHKAHLDNYYQYDDPVDEQVVISAYLEWKSNKENKE